MVPEIGQYAMILALLLAAAQAFFGLAGPWRGAERWTQAVYPAVAGQFVLLALAFGCLVWSFVNNDFSVLLGSGTPLFRGLGERVRLKLLEARPVQSGNVLLRYRLPAAV